jgi:predicted secreted protein
MSDAIIGWGTLLKLAGTTIDEVNSIKPPGISNEDVEVTHLTSAGRRKEFTAGMIDAEELDFTVNYIPGNASHELLITTAQAGTAVTWQIIMPDTAETIEFDGILSLEFGEIQPNGKVELTGKIKTTGDVDYDA